jgi:hypothetical protein
MGDFLAINGRDVGIAAFPLRKDAYQNEAYGDEAIFWYLAFSTSEDAREWYDISAMEF